MAYSMNIKTSQKIIDWLQLIPSLACQDDQDTEGMEHALINLRSPELQQAKTTARALTKLSHIYHAYSVT